LREYSIKLRFIARFVYIKISQQTNDLPVTQIFIK